MTSAWLPIRDSTVVSAARYDQAAKRIFIRTHRGLVRGFEDCSDRDWAEFTASHTRKGEFVTRILERRREVRHDTPPRPGRTARASRAMVLNAFSPAQELEEPRRFAGRREQVLAVADALQLKGSVPLIFGDSGVGKSSLAVQAQLIAMGDEALLEQLSALSYSIPPESVFITVFLSCSDEIADLSELLQSLINAAEDVVPADESGSAPTFLVDRSTRAKLSVKLFEAESTRRYATAKERLSYESLSLPEKLLRVTRLLNETYNAPVLFVVDEIDRVRDKKGLASVIRRLSTDYLKFMLVGIAQDWSDLMLDHASLARQAAPIRLPRMTSAELAEIVDLASAYLEGSGIDMRFSDAARTRLVRIAGGFPWFVHVIGQAALMNAFDEASSFVTDEHVVIAMRGLVANQFAQEFSDRYRMAVRQSSQREVVLRAFAQWNDGDIPTSSIYSKAKLLGVSNPSIYMGHLSSDQYGSVLMRPSLYGRGVVRFRNEMFKGSSQSRV